MRPAEELRYLILAAQREGNRQLGQALRPLGVTASQAEVLRILQDRQPLTLNGLGDLLVCESGSSPSRLVDRLAAAGLVDRVVAVHDRRQVQLTLTAAGADLARQIAEIEETLYRSIDAASEGLDLTQLTGFLRTFVAGLPAGQALARRKDTST
ncbi:MarR family winged helix-turn-helix transcriptional regulator [Dactylosporangium cerinum]|uniref:MarR family winged helix-turn-helix transcriptional regulator n=1 Tax=Dactylosporangium cerinum TaxID=1434730 RepID=A0ABV9WFD5_9ACTN